MSDDMQTNVDVAISPEKAGLIVRTLAELPRDALMDETALANALQVCPRTLQRMIKRFELPPGISLAGRKVWFPGQVLDFLAKRADAVREVAERERARLRLL